MKETGIVRRIDELGRVVIPKEIRRTMHIKEGDPLEIFTERETLLLKKYSPMTIIEDIIKNVADSLYTLTEMNVVVCGTDKVLAARGKGAKDLLDKDISEELSAAIADRRTVFSDDGGKEDLPVTADGRGFKKQIIVPLISEGDALGALVLGDDYEQNIDAGFLKMTMLAAEFIGRQA